MRTTSSKIQEGQNCHDQGSSCGCCIGNRLLFTQCKVVAKAYSLLAGFVNKETWNGMIMLLCCTFKEKQMIAHNKDQIVVVKIFNDPLAANFAQNKLREEGIESFLADENVVGLNPLGGIELKIFSNDLKKAKKILSEIKFS